MAKLPPPHTHTHKSTREQTYDVTKYVINVTDKSVDWKKKKGSKKESSKCL